MSGDASSILFVRNERDLAIYLPLVKRWLQADLVGGNADCENPKLTDACKLSQEIEIPITAYQIVGAGKDANELRKLPVPDLPASSWPIKLFKK